MTYKHLPRTLPAQLRAAGLKVVVIDGWHGRGRPSSTGQFHPVGVLNHHTGAFDREGDLADDLSYAKWLFSGPDRAGLPKPLCQLALSVEGTVYLGASGRANHAGTAKPVGSVAGGDGNALYVGIEWMLSGRQPIPAKMYTAGAKLNAVLLKVLGSSEQAVACHYQTSTTGKWDIGDPAGIEFRGAKVLNVAKFRGAVKAWKLKIYAPPAPTSSVLTMSHVSMQSRDTLAQETADFNKALSRGKLIVTGTEAFTKATQDALQAAADKYGYRLHRWREEWVAVKKSLIKGGWKTGGELVIESYEGEGRHSDRGIAWVSFTTEHLGRITVGAGHYLTQGRRPGQPNYVLNRRFASAIGKWANLHGKGSALVFYNGDQNILDRTDDTFFGSPLTSAQDELKKWEATHPSAGGIDVAASYDPDARVSPRSVNALKDTELKMFTDHYVVDVAWNIRHLN